MVKYQEQFFYGRLLCEVVNSGAGKQQNKTECLNTGAYNARCIIVRGGNPGQHRQCAYPENDPQTMYQPVYDLLFTAISLFIHYNCHPVNFSDVNTFPASICSIGAKIS